MAVVVRSRNYTTGQQLPADTYDADLDEIVAGVNDITNAQINAGANIAATKIAGTAATLAGSETLTNKTISGASNTLSNLSASNLASGTVPTARLGTGTPSSDTFLRGDQTWAAAGKYVKMSSATLTSVATGTTVTPIDDTIPQSSEMDEYLTVSHTPSSASNNLLIELVANVSVGSNQTVVMGLFKDSDTDALAVTATSIEGSEVAQLKINYVMQAGSTSAITFKLKVGRGNEFSTTVTVNGRASTRLFGGKETTSIVVQEIQP